MRSEARSATDWEKLLESCSHEARSCGTRRCQAESEPVADRAILDRPSFREDDLGQASRVVREDQLVVRLVENGRHRLGERRRVLWIAEGVVVRLDGEDVREVRPDLQRELELDRPRSVVLDDDVLLHAVPDEAVASHGDLVRPEIADHRVAKIKGGREIVDLVGRENEGARAVDRQYPAGKEAGVVGEEAHHGRGDVAALVGRAERRAIEDR
jgi:hypothetical protein